MSKVATDESVEKMLKEHEGEWIAFVVTEEDEGGQATRGELIAHSPRSADVFAALKARGVDGTCVLYSGEHFPEGRHYFL
jgi:hypothetical protein